MTSDKKSMLVWLCSFLISIIIQNIPEFLDSISYKIRIFCQEGFVCPKSPGNSQGLDTNCFSANHVLLGVANNDRLVLIRIIFSNSTLQDVSLVESSRCGPIDAVKKLSDAKVLAHF